MGSFLFAATRTPTTPVISATQVSQTSIQIALVTPSTETKTGIKFYRLMRARGAGAYVQIATIVGAAFPYSDTGLTAGTTYSYKAVATNNAPNGDSSAPSAIVNATTAAATGGSPHKFAGTTGIYMLSNNINGTASPVGNGSNAAEFSAYSRYNNKIVGWSGYWTWRALETSEGVYNFNAVIGADFLAGQAAVPGSFFGIQILAWAEFFAGNPLTPAQVSAKTFSAPLPDYILNCGGTLDGNAVAAGPNGFQYGFAVGSWDGTHYNEIYGAFWIPIITTKLIAMYQALANTVVPDGSGLTYDLHPQIPFIYLGDEFSLSLASGGFNPPAGCNYATCAAQYLRLVTAVAAAFPHTMVVINYSFGVAAAGAQETYQQLLNDLLTLSAVNGVAFGGADCQGASFTASHAESPPMWMYAGNSFANMTLAVGASTAIAGGNPSLINKMPCILQMESPDWSEGKKSGVASNSQQAVTDCLTASQVIGATHILVCCAGNESGAGPNTDWGGAGTTNPGFIYSAIQAFGATNTTRPSLLT